LHSSPRVECMARAASHVHCAGKQMHEDVAAAKNRDS